MSQTESTRARSQWLLAIPCLLLALPALLLFFRELFVSYGIYDEGLILYGAQRVADGAVPYRDFWTLYAPGQFYVLAALFRAFGTSIVVERVWSAFVLAGIVWALVLLVRRSARPLFAVLAGVCAIAWLAETPMPGSPLPVAIGLALASLVVLEGSLRRESKRSLFVAAGLAGAAALFRHDLAALLWIAQLARLGVARCNPLPYLLGLLSVTLPAAALLLSAVPVGTLMDSLVFFPLDVFPEVRRLPFPPLTSNPAFYLAPCLLLLALVRTAMHWRAGDRLDGAWYSALLLGLLLLQQAQVRSDLNHMLPSTLLAFAVACMMFEDLAQRPLRLSAAKLPAALAAAALAVGVGTALLGSVRSLQQSQGQTLIESTLPRAAGIRVPPPKQRYEAVVRFVRKTVPESQAIFVGNTRHDTILFNDVIFYFLAERDSATAYHELHPGAATEAPVQTQIVRDLEAVETVVLANILGEEANGSSESSGIHLLDHYIAANFSRVHEAGGYRVLQKR